MCGTSAGAVCWFNSFATNSQEQGLHSAEGLNFVDVYLTAHGQENKNLEFFRQAIANNNKLGVLLTNGAAMEIADDKCRFIIKENDDFFPFYARRSESYAMVSYFDNGEYFEERFNSTTNIEALDKSLVRKL